MALPWPEAATIDEPTLAGQIVATARELPQRPLVLGGCCCAHVGAVRELVRRYGRIAFIWFDGGWERCASQLRPSGNAWGMPLRMLIDAGEVEARDVTLLGARALDPPEADFIQRAGIRRELGELPDHVYVALYCDVFAPGSLDVFMPESGGPTPAGLEPVFAAIRAPVGLGLTGLVPSERNEAILPRLARALGF